MNREEFYHILATNNLVLSTEQKNQLHTYFELLVEKNKVMNLTGITEENEVYEKHFYDSLLFSFDIDFSGKTLIDVGTGAGFPGLVLAICYPNLKVTLLEPLNKRCVFLSEVVTALGLQNVEIVNQRSEDYSKNNREKFDYATARAVARLNILLELVMPLVKVNGTFVALKGRLGYEEVDESKRALELLDCKVSKIQDVKLLTDDDSRQNIFVLKLKKTNMKYPRNYSQIKNKAL